jgi:hypothetical protein
MGAIQYTPRPSQQRVELKQLTFAIVMGIVAAAAISTYALDPDARTSTTGSTPISSTALSPTITFTQDEGSAVPNGCSTLVKSVSSQGYEVDAYVSSTSIRQGDVACIDVVLLNTNGTNMTLSNWTVSYNITASDGQVFFQTICTPSSPPASSDNTTTSDDMHFASCAGQWNTGPTNQGLVPPPGTYDFTVDANVPNAQGPGYSTVSYTTTLTVTN